MRVRFRVVAVAAIALVGSMSATRATERCPLTKAHYTLSSDKGFSIRFIPVGKLEGWRSDVALRIDKTGFPSYWFLFDGGSARYINMISTTNVQAANWMPPTGDGGIRPLGEMHYFAWSGKYDFNNEFPQAKATAPERIFLPDLAETMWYAASPRLGVKHGVFIRNRCDR
ncbi:hypothetical protein ACVWWJ_004026 [Luteibacter sp. HA06]